MSMRPTMILVAFLLLTGVACPTSRAIERSTRPRVITTRRVVVHNEVVMVPAATMDTYIVTSTTPLKPRDLLQVYRDGKRVGEVMVLKVAVPFGLVVTRGSTPPLRVGDAIAYRSHVNPPLLRPVKGRETVFLEERDVMSSRAIPGWPTFSLPSFQMPGFSGPSFSMPTFTLPTFSSPTFSAPSFVAPGWSTPGWSGPSWSLPTFAAPGFSW